MIRRWLTWLCGWLLCLSCSLSAAPGRVHLVVASGLDLQGVRDLTKAPQLSHGLLEASWGLMSIGGERRASPGVLGTALATGLRDAPDLSAMKVQQWVKARRGTSLAELLRRYRRTVNFNAPDDGRRLLGSGSDADASLWIHWIGPESPSPDRDLKRVLTEAITRGDRVILVGAPVDDQVSLIPIVVSMPGAEGGLLTSASTRTAGLVKDSNVAALIAEFLEIQPPDVWRSMETRQSKGPLQRWITLTRLSAGSEQQRRLIIPVILLIALTAVGAISTVWVSRSRKQAMVAACVVLCALSSLPLIFHLLGVISATAGPLRDWQFLSIVIAGLVLAGICAKRMQASTGLTVFYVWICLVTIVVMLTDAALGCHGARYSLIGAYLISGIRLYGLGNEYLGVILGGLGVAWLAARPSMRPTVAVLWLLSVLAMGMPWIGANLGGFAASLAGFGTVLIWQWAKSHSIWSRFILVAAGWIIAWLLQAVMVAVDILTKSNTHMGDVWRRTNGDPGDAGWTLLFETKLKLMTAVLTNPYTLLAAAGAFVAVLAVRHLTARQHRMLPARLLPTFIGLAIPVAIMNDSGVVPALIVTGYLAVWVLIEQGANDGIRNSAC